jgi:DNA ligase-associated metallophosphoesterase
MKRDNDLAINFKDQHLILLPEKAIYWKEERALLVADIHLGKSGHFRKAGIPVTKNVNNENLSRLETITKHFDPTVIYFLGDLFHSHQNDEWGDFKRWRNKNSSIVMNLILGNHDFYSVPEYENFGLTCSHSLEVSPFIFIHEVPDLISSNDMIYLGGHVHPSIRFSGKGRQSLKAPCFYFSKNKILLPAFGTFTGTHNIRPKKNDLVFPILDNIVTTINHIS